ncbi:DMP12 family DNA mimic protein [Hymenobacter cellulosilyticus]|uniref:DMP12 family DNA mimic protein n=1 Tax=Hymenobacter cellulosilyticus TaxID=2932248 RepID=A0A8T9Q3X8_9BACT|nr:DMP12 family DNA mimic protein [Hymenobacter cellulosilyticus]UOQ72274.1 DMP12 family DNA mimic protein [Hymenobacter cellulosilyticus]
MNLRFFLCVPDESVDEDELEYSDVVDWALSHATHQNVLILTEEEVYFLDYQTAVLDIINEENDSMLQWGENDWVIDDQAKLRIRKRLLEYQQKLQAGKAGELVTKILRLLTVSIETRKHLYFNF